MAAKKIVKKAASKKIVKKTGGSADAMERNNETAKKKVVKKTPRQNDGNGSASPGMSPMTPAEDAAQQAAMRRYWSGLQVAAAKDRKDKFNAKEQRRLGRR
jgi:hypothetical protein